jgi:hypothetical protein
LEGCIGLRILPGVDVTAGRAESLTLETLRARWDAVAERVAARDRVHGEWARWCWPRAVQGGVVDVDAPIRERHT